MLIWKYAMGEYQWTFFCLDYNSKISGRKTECAPFTHSTPYDHESIIVLNLIVLCLYPHHVIPFLWNVVPRWEEKLSHII